MLLYHYRIRGTTISKELIKELLVNLVEASHLYEAPTAELRSWDPEPDLEGKRAWAASGFQEFRRGCFKEFGTLWSCKGLVVRDSRLLGQALGFKV